mgnify:CR=1 FL=1
MRIEPMTCAIGAELLGVRLADAVRDDALFSEIRAALLRHKVLFLRDQGPVSYTHLTLPTILLV